MNRKASLSLSITAIVVIVIAFVVLGLGLSLTRQIFKGAEQKLPQALALTELEAEPTASNPITLQQQVEIGRGKLKTMSIGYYNRNQNTATGATFRINECLDGSGASVPADKLPGIASGKQDVGPSSALAYSIIAEENGLQAGTYICTMVVCKCTTEECNQECQQNIYETKQFFLQVIA